MARRGGLLSHKRTLNYFKRGGTDIVRFWDYLCIKDACGVGSLSLSKGDLLNNVICETGKEG